MPKNSTRGFHLKLSFLHLISNGLTGVNINNSSMKIVTLLTYYSSVTDLLIIPMIFVFLTCCQKAHDNKKTQS